MPSFFDSFFIFLEDTSIICNHLFERFTTFATPYLLPIVDYGIRTYVWIHHLPFFQQEKHRYADIIASESWNYIGFLVRIQSSIPFSTEYRMIHHYDLAEDQELVKDLVKYENLDKDETIYMIQQEKICVCRRTPFRFIKPEKSNIHFLYIEFIIKGMVLALDIPEEMMQVGNELFTPAFLYRLLDLQHRSFAFDFDYHLIIVDEHLNTVHIYSNTYMVLEQNTYRLLSLTG